MCVQNEKSSLILKRSYDAILKIIIWCNRICWHALMFKKHIVFQILYIIVGPLCPASLKTLRFLQSPSFRQAQSALIGQLTQCNAIGRTVTTLTIIASFSFQVIVSFTISSSPRGTRVAWQTRWWSSYVFAHKPWLRRFLTGCTLLCDVTLVKYLLSTLLGSRNCHPENVLHKFEHLGCAVLL